MDKKHIHVGKRLVKFEMIADDRVRLFFEDGYKDEVDVLVGADGIRSVCETLMERVLLTDIQKAHPSDLFPNIQPQLQWAVCISYHSQ